MRTGQLFRVNSDGSVDAEFSPQINSTASAEGTGVRRAVVLQDGRIVISGYFSSINGVPRRNLARLNSDGSLDQSFSPARAGSFQMLPTGQLIVQSDTLYRLHSDGRVDNTFVAQVPPGDSGYGSISSFLVQGDGKVVYSQRLNFYGTDAVRRLNPDGSADSSFQLWSAQFVSTRLIQHDGKIIAGGARLNPDGSPDPSFRIEPLFVSEFAQQADGKLVVAGQFDTAPFGVRRLHLDGSFDETFAPEAGGLTGIGRTSVERVATLPNGRVAVGGPFNHFDAVPRRALAVLHADGTVDQTFDAGDLIKPAATNGELTVSSLVAQPDGKLLVVSSRNRLVRLEQTGAVDPTFSYRPANRESYALITGVGLQGTRVILSGADGLVRLQENGNPDPSFQAAQSGTLLLVEPDGKIVVRGSQGAVVRLHPDGQMDTVFSGIGGVVGFTPIYAVARQPDGKYLVSRGDPSQSRDLFIRLHNDGTRDESFAPSIAKVENIAVDQGGVIVAGNIAPQADVSQRQKRYGVARLNFDGARDALFQPVEFNAGASVSQLSIDADRNLLVIGN
ncbi:MAG TPA: hypothetical protein VK993_03950, partial [Chthoniobacterales bacterium]|nr:hypothetical protein [Chthoniobacterales bacterium]